MRRYYHTLSVDGHPLRRCVFHVLRDREGGRGDETGAGVAGAGPGAATSPGLAGLTPAQTQNPAHTNELPTTGGLGRKWSAVATGCRGGVRRRCLGLPTEHRRGVGGTGGGFRDMSLRGGGWRSSGLDTVQNDSGCIGSLKVAAEDTKLHDELNSFRFPNKGVPVMGNTRSPQRMVLWVRERLFTLHAGITGSDNKLLFIVFRTRLSTTVSTHLGPA